MNSTRTGRTGARQHQVRIVLLMLCLVLLSTGCVRRRMTIRSNVDDQGGALAIVDNQEIGFTPTSTGYTYYAPRRIKLIKDGFETEELVQEFPAPRYGIFPLDFFFENLWPFTIRDDREFVYNMKPARIIPKEEVWNRGEGLRNEARLHSEIIPVANQPAENHGSRAGF